jgi:hypothetical protein
LLLLLLLLLLRVVPAVRAGVGSHIGGYTLHAATMRNGEFTLATRPRHRSSLGSNVSEEGGFEAPEVAQGHGSMQDWTAVCGRIPIMSG